MMPIWVRPLMAINILLYRLTGGRLGSKMVGQSVLLLHTVGHKSGTSYTTPLNYFEDGKSYVLVASNWGEAHNPGWYYNLLHQPTATIQIKDQSIQVKPRLALTEEYDRLWKYVTSKNNFYNRYQAHTKRKIPLVILTPEQ